MNRRCMCLTVITVFAAVAQDGAVQRPRQWGEQAGPYRLSIASDKDRYENGEKVRITATFKNVTGERVWLATGPPAAFFKITVKVPVPEWMHWSPEAAPIPEALQRALGYANVAGGPLDGGAELSKYMDLAWLYDLTKPGKYQVTFSCEVPVKFGDPTRVHLVSNEITFTVLPKQP